MASDTDSDAADTDATAGTGGITGFARRVRLAVARIESRLHRIERREVSELRRWAEDTENLVHLSALVFVPLLVAAVTELSNVVTAFSFLLFPPLASGTFTLFADPEGEYSDPVRFVVGLTGGAACGWVALRLMDVLFPGQSAAISPAAAAFAILLTGGVTWAFTIEEPPAFSASLLVLAAPGQGGLYVLFTLLASAMVAIVFAAWRGLFYEQRASLLYGTTRADDHVLVPMRGENERTMAMFGARLAAAHEAGKVVLLDIVEDEGIAEVKHTALEGGSVGAATDRADVELDDETASDAAEAAANLQSHAEHVRTTTGVPCEVVVAAGGRDRTVRSVARETNCDLVVTPYEEELGLLSPFVRSVFGGPIDAVALRPCTDHEHWRRVLVLVARPGDSAHAMVDFATRLAGNSGFVSACTCIDSEAERRPAENRLANVVGTADRSVETRVARSDVMEFVEANAQTYDLVMIGSSRDRSKASRIVSPPTFRKVRDLDCDVAVVDRGSLE